MQPSPLSVDRAAGASPRPIVSSDAALERMSAPAGVPDELWRPLSAAERGLVLALPPMPQQAPAARPGGYELGITLGAGLRAARTNDAVMLHVQVGTDDGGWRTVTNAEARDGQLQVGDLGALRQAWSGALPDAVVQSPQALPEAQATTTGTPDLSSIEVSRRGAAYRDSQVVDWSHYRDAIDTANGRAAGDSRIWGDAPADTQAASIDALVRASQAAGLDHHQTALMLAIARTESGFNPDAAAGTTSASGLGQFIDRTGTSYGLDDTNRWNVGDQASALVRHFQDNQALARSRGQGDEYIYKYHHDGPSGDYGGLAISNDSVMPMAQRIESLLDGDPPAAQ